MVDADTVVVAEFATPTRLPRAGLFRAGRPLRVGSRPTEWALATRALIASRVLVLIFAAAGVLLIRPVIHGVWWDHLGSAARLLAASGARWDAGHYLAIAQHGYDRAYLTPFFPLYPALIHAVSWITRSGLAAGMLISFVAFWVGLELTWRLTNLELGPRAADATVLLLAFAPLSFFFTAIYSESLFLALSVGALYAARQHRWALAGTLTALATLTRNSGLLLLVPVALMYFLVHRKVDRNLAWLLLPFAGLLGFLAFLTTQGYQPLAPLHEEALFGRSNAGPLTGFVEAVQAAVGGIRVTLGGVPPFQPHIFSFTIPFEALILFGVLTVSVLALAGITRRLPAPYVLYSGLTIVLCLSSPVPAQPLISFDRYMLTVFPLWMGAGAWLSRRKRAPVVCACAIGLAFYSFQFSTGAWVA